MEGSTGAHDRPERAHSSVMTALHRSAGVAAAAVDDEVGAGLL